MIPDNHWAWRIQKASGAWGQSPLNTKSSLKILGQNLFFIRFCSQIDQNEFQKILREYPLETPRYHTVVMFGGLQGRQTLQRAVELHQIVVKILSLDIMFSGKKLIRKSIATFNRYKLQIRICMLNLIGIFIC